MPPLIALYLGLARVAPPLWSLALRAHARKGIEDPARLPEKWGKPASPRPPGELIWLHGVSVGESNALLTLITRLGRERPKTHFLLTTISRASVEALERRELPPRVIHHYAPIDCPGPVRAFLDHWRPDLFILSEMDLWPCLLHEASRREIPMLMLNADVTPRRHRRRRRAARANGWLMDRFTEIHVQDARSQALFQEIGAPGSKMRVTGLLKAASAPPPDLPEARAALEAQIGDRSVWLAASTKMEEEAQVMQAHAHALTLSPEMLMIVAPRQMKDADVTEAAARAEFPPDRIARRSRGEPITPRTCVYIADSLGEMGMWLRMVKVAYTGQSLPLEGGVFMGGKNPFEALALGVLVVHGPQTGNFQEAYRMLREAGAAVEVAGQTELGKVVVAAQDADYRAPYLEAARTVLAQTRAPLDAASSAVERLLGPPEAHNRARHG